MRLYALRMIFFLTDTCKKLFYNFWNQPGLGRVGGNDFTQSQVLSTNHFEDDMWYTLAGFELVFCFFFETGDNVLKSRSLDTDADGKFEFRLRSTDRFCDCKPRKSDDFARTQIFHDSSIGTTCSKVTVERFERLRFVIRKKTRIVRSFCVRA